MRRPSIRRWLRTAQWWNSKPPLMAAVAYWELVVTGPTEPLRSALTAVMLFLAATFGLAAFGYLLNDFGDRESDRLSGEPNGFVDAGPTWGLIGFVALIALAALPWIWLPTPVPVLALLGLEVILFAAYVLPPLRLKTRGAAGPVTDAVYGYVVPLLVSLLVFADLTDSHPSAWRLGILVSWAFVLGLRHIISHQLQDAGRDERARSATFARGYGWMRTFVLLERVILPLEALLFATLLVVIGWDAPAVLLGFLAHATWVLARRRRRSVPGAVALRRLPSITRPGLLGGEVMSEFQVRWLPLLLLATLVWREPSYIALLAAHLLVFETGLHRLWRYEMPAWRRARHAI